MEKTGGIGSIFRESDTRYLRLLLKPTPNTMVLEPHDFMVAPAPKWLRVQEKEGAPAPGWLRLQAKIGGSGGLRLRKPGL